MVRWCSAGLAGRFSQRALGRRVDEVLTAHPTAIQGSADIVDAYEVLKNSGVRRLPVLEDDDLAGIVSVDDLLVALVLELGAVVSPIAKETPQRAI
jgi:predicted transcriptional regulator